MRFLLRKGLEANPRSRYVYLSWALWEKKQGQLDDARRLFERGCKLNPSDTALLQVPSTDHCVRFLACAAVPQGLQPWLECQMLQCSVL